jgi:ribosomal protein S6--L-glutamate ligase
LVKAVGGEKPKVALGKRLRNCSLVQTLGVRPNIDDYERHELDRLREAETVYYPSRLYEDVFLAVGKRVFPANHYRFMGDKIKQTELFTLLDIPHPRTRIYYGKDKSRRILAEFSFPFIAKIPRGSSKGRGVFLVRNLEELRDYLGQFSPAYIQEYVPLDRDLRVVLLGGKAVHAYWRIARPGEFRCNVSQGALISLEEVPAEALHFAESVARSCGFDEVGLDLCSREGTYLVLEANMVYGLKGFAEAHLDIYELLNRRALEEGL